MRALASPWTLGKITYDLETPWRLCLGDTKSYEYVVSDAVAPNSP